MVLTNEMLADGAEHIKIEITNSVSIGNGTSRVLHNHVSQICCFFSEIMEYYSIPPTRYMTLEPRIFYDLLSSGRDLQNMCIERSGHMDPGLRNIMVCIEQYSNFNFCEEDD